MTRYYYAGVERIAMRSGTGSGTAGLVWIVGDHLGSTAFTVNAATGLKQSERRYKPWGEVRYTEGEMGTKYGFTGQMAETAGLYFYHSRFYDSLLGRFVQADTLIPNAYNPRDWDRYSYVKNNPIKYIDPSGHRVAECGYYDCEKNEGNHWFSDLTEHGREVYDDYIRLNAQGGWWNNGIPGGMSPQEFLGLMIYWETTSLPGSAPYIKEAAINGLWMTVTDEMAGGKGRSANCQSTCDPAGIFNFLGREADPNTKGGHITGRVDQILRGDFSGDGNAWMEEARKWGRDLTQWHYVPSSNDVPLHWGQIKDNALDRINNAGFLEGYNGLEMSSIVYFWPLDFVVFTANQGSNWGIGLR